MKAAIRNKYVDFSEIKVNDIPIPEPKDDEVLIKVHATTVNRTGCALVNAKPFIMRFFIGFWKPKLKVLGTDFAGEVVKVGKNVKDYNIGDRVMGFHDEGMSSHAEYTTVSISKAIAPIPDRLDCIEATACMEATHYAYSWIKDREIDSRHRVLINGVTGAIGTALIQFLSSRGADITAVGNGKNLELIKKLGADKIFNYETEEFTRCKLRYDYILDAVGKSTFGKCKHLLKPKGVYISSELGPWWQNPLLAIFTAWSSGKRVEFPLPKDIPSSIEHVVSQVENNSYKPVIERVYPLDEVANAYAYVASGNKTGNVILTIS